MFAAFARLLVVVAAGSLLGGCIISKYDISAVLPAEYPLRPGTYLKDDGPGETLTITRVGNGYRFSQKKGQAVQNSNIRLFRIAEYPDGYVVQVNAATDFFYVFGRINSDGSLSYYDVDNLQNVVPAHLKAQVTIHRPKDGSNNYNISVLNPARDTLYVIRELARSGLEMKELASYSPAP